MAEADLDDPAVQQQVLCVAMQVIATIMELYANGIFHNDVHGENVLLARWPADQSLDTIGYSIGPYDYELSRDGCHYLAKLIDYGLTTTGQALDGRYNPVQSPAVSYPWLDICQFLASLAPYSKQLPFVEPMIRSLCQPSAMFSRGRKDTPALEGAGLREFGRLAQLIHDWAVKYQLSASTAT